MLEGVTVLNAYVEVNAIAVIGLWIAFILFAAASVYGWYLAAKRSTISHFIVAIVVSVLCIGALIGATITPITEETYYQVTIDKEVSFLEFTEFYEVVKVEGHIYTIKEIPHEIPETIPPASDNPTEPDNTWDPSADG